jgi:hypothetical protein
LDFVRAEPGAGGDGHGGDYSGRELVVSSR